MRRRLVRLAVAAGAGALLSMAFHPVDAGWVAWFAVAPLLVLATLDRGRGFVLECTVFGAVSTAIGAAWLFELTPAAGVGATLFVALLSYLPLGLVLRSILRGGRVPLVAAAPIAWVAFDWVRTWFATGFPWFFLSHTQWDEPDVIRVSAWAGAHAVTFAMMAVNAVLAHAACTVLPGLGRPGPIARAWWAVPGFAGALLVAAALAGPPETPPDRLRVAVVQGNIPQFLKDQAIEGPGLGAQAVLDRHIRLTARAVRDAERLWGGPPDLVLWPETTLPGTAGWPYPGRILAWVGETARAPAIVGTMIHEDARETNSAILVDPAGRLRGRYDKVHPVPVSESIPYRAFLPRSFLEWVEERVEAIAGFRPVQTPGESLEPLEFETRDGDRAAGVLICFEVIYPAIAREMARGGAHVLANITNYGWFRESAQLDQALAITVFRAVETGRPVIVAANTGISAVATPDGRISDVLVTKGERKSVEGWLLAEVPIDAGTAPSRTPYLVIGDALAIILAFLTALLLALPLAVNIPMLARSPVRRVSGQDGSGVSS